MTNHAEILKKAIEKSHKFGSLIVIISKDEEWDNLLKDNAYYGLIFNHKFAKAFWGETTQWMYLSNGEPIEIVGQVPDKIEEWEEYEANNGWQYHLQQMVLEEDCLNYLKKFL